MKKFVEEYRLTLERASIPITAERLIGGIAGAALVVWLGYTVTMHPGPLIAVVALGAALALSTSACGVYVRLLVGRRLSAFNGQLELALRLIASGLRVGLSLRQALVLVIDELPEPARHEFMRVVGQTNIGISLYDALDRLRERMPSNEVTMMVRAIRIQSQTGGNLSKVLENLGDTIKSRRRIDRKIKVLTSESRASAFIICALPFAVGGMIFYTQPHMRDVMFTSTIGHLALLGVVVLEAAGAFTISRMMAFAV